MIEWTETTLGELGVPSRRAFATGPFGSAIASKFFTLEGVPVIRGSNLSLDVGSRLVLDDVVFVSADKAREHERSVVVQGDLVFTCWGTVGQVGLVDSTGRFDRLLISNKQMKMTPDPDRVDSLYLYYLLSSPAMVRAVQSRAIGAAVPGFNLGQLREIRVSMPDRQTQRRIAAVLAVFDELIAINKRRIEVLENLARTLYREWFVRHVARDETRPTTIADVAESVRGTISPLKHPAVDFEHFSIPAFDAGGLPVHEIGAAIKSNKTMLDGECVLLSKLNPRIRRVWLAVPTSDRPVASTEFLAWQGRSVSNEWLWATFQEDNFQRQMAGSAGGTSTSHQRVKLADVAAYPIRLASDDKMRSFDLLTKPALRQATELRRANSALARSRDLLLPRLVTGRLDLSEVDIGYLLPQEAAA